MNSRSTVAGRRLAAVALVLVAAVPVVLALGATPASAHAELESTEPGSGAVLQTAPDEVVLSFTEAVRAGEGAVRVYDRDGEGVDDGRLRRPAGDDTLAVGLRDLPDGGYVIAYRVVSADSHPISGAATFRVGDAAAVQGDVVAAVVSGGDAGAGVEGAAAVVRFLVFASLVVLLGGVAFLVLVWPAGATSPGVGRVVAGAWVVLVATTIAGLGLQAAEEQGLGLLDALRPSVLTDVLGSRFGVASMVRLGLLVLAVPLLLALGRGVPGDPEWRAPAAIVGTGLLVTLGLAGHASSGDLVPLALVTDVVHVGAVSVWLGGLVFLLAFVLRRRDAQELRATVPRFSGLALAAVGAIVLTGTIQGWRQVESLGALGSTTYGRLLLVKTGAVAGLVALGALSRAVVRRRLWAPSPVMAYPAGPGAALADPDAAIVGRLRRAVGIEVAVAVGVLAVTALLVDAEPARSASGPEPFAGTVEAGDADVDIRLTPGGTGPNDLTLTVRRPEGEPIEVSATVSLPERDVGEIDVPVERTAPGRWTATDVDLPIAGEWRLELRLLLTETDVATASTTVPVR